MSRARCERCLRPIDHCLCALIPALDSRTRVLILQHPSDPVTWWSPSLLLERPDWLAEEPGRDVLPEMTWIPLVTFWQVTLDMPFSTDVPEGHGHRYTRESVDAWALLLRPAAWTPKKADRLRSLIR